MMFSAALSTLIASLDFSWQFDGPIILVAVLCAVATAIPGNFLVLRRLSLLGDAISHAVLPGLAGAFLITGSRASLPLFIGAVIVGALTAFFTGWVARVGRVDEGASMGVVFTSLFAIGLIMIVQVADSVDLDVSCVLYGSIETVGLDQTKWMGITLPRAAWSIGAVLVVNLLFVVLFYKELQLASFDAGLATSSGFSAAALHYALMILVAVTAVASFESVGSVLVVAMFIVPPATAFLLTRRLGRMISLSVVIAAASAVGGYFAAVAVPRLFGFGSTMVSGSIAVVAGLFFLIAVLVSPQMGLIPRWYRARLLSREILRDDVIAFLYRVDERINEGQDDSATDFQTLRQVLFCRASLLRSVIDSLKASGDVVVRDDDHHLTKRGYRSAAKLVRSHRLWETYLQDHADVPPSRLHAHAERLEHFTDPRLREQLDRQTDAATDPHGRPIPSEALGSDPPYKIDEPQTNDSPPKNRD